MKRDTSLILLVAVLVISTAINLFLVTFQHERAHAQYCSYTGGNATISYTWAAGFTQCDSNDERLVILDGLNEIVGYVAMGIITAIAVTGALVMFYVREVTSEKNKAI